MKKIAIPSDGEKFASHFGRCPEFKYLFWKIIFFIRPILSRE
ncbi:MAG: hypothetical protein ACOCQA_01200 [bacterium]